MKEYAFASPGSCSTSRTGRWTRSHQLRPSGAFATSWPHLAGSTADVVSGNLEGVGTDVWTRAQVESRRDKPIGDVLDEWARCGEIVESMISTFDPRARAMLLTDAVTHEQDLRGALGAPGARDVDAITFGFHSVSRGIGAQRGSGGLHIFHEAGETVVGSGAPTAILRTSRFEILRAGVGRRSYDQIAGWDWEGDARAETMVLARFVPPRTTPLYE